MPKKLGEFFKQLAQKSGAKLEGNEALTNELAAPDFERLTVSDEMATLLDNGLLSVETAKNNHPDIKKHYTAAVYNGIDARMNTLMEEMKIPDDVKAVILNERSTPERIALFAKKVQEIEAKKKATDTDKDTQSLKQQINDLNAQMATEKQSLEAIKNTHKEELTNIRMQQKVDTLLGSYKTIFDELPHEARTAALNSLVTKALQDKDAVLKVDENGKLSLIRRDGANVFDEGNRQLDPALLFDKVFSQNKVLKVTDAAGDKNGQQNNNSSNGAGGTTQKTIIEPDNNNGQNNSNAPKVDKKLGALASQALKDLEDNSGKRFGA